MPYVNFTANPKNETNDCAIRSIAKATGRPWQDVMREMCDIAIEMCLMPNDTKVIDEYMYKRKIFVYSPLERTTVSKFAQKNPEGAYVVCCEDHAVPIVDGTWYDLTDSKDSVIVDYYEVKPEV